MLHTDADLSIAVEGPVEAHNVGGVTLMQNLQLSDDLVPDGRLDLQVDQLEYREETRSAVSDNSDNSCLFECMLSLSFPLRPFCCHSVCYNQFIEVKSNLIGHIHMVSRCYWSHRHGQQMLM